MAFPTQITSPVSRKIDFRDLLGPFGTARVTLSTKLLLLRFADLGKSWCYKMFRGDRMAHGALQAGVVRHGLFADDPSMAGVALIRGRRCGVMRIVA